MIKVDENHVNSDLENLIAELTKLDVGQSFVFHKKNYNLIKKALKVTNIYGNYEPIVACPDGNMRFFVKRVATVNRTKEEILYRKIIKMMPTNRRKVLKKFHIKAEHLDEIERILELKKTETFPITYISWGTKYID